jgi:hypothetical protein
VRLAVRNRSTFELDGDVQYESAEEVAEVDDLQEFADGDVDALAASFAEDVVVASREKNMTETSVDTIMEAHRRLNAHLPPALRDAIPHTLLQVNSSINKI